MARTLKRSHAPIFWLPFGAGGLMAALIGPMLAYLSGIGGPLGLGVPPELMSYPRMLAFSQNWAGKLFLFLVIALLLWHAALRIYHTLHDLGVHMGTGLTTCLYGLTLVFTVMAAWALLSIGF
jgi:succinate dehydrogenase subunit D